MYVCMYACIFVCIHFCMYACMYVCIPTPNRRPRAANVNSKCSARDICQVGVRVRFQAASSSAQRQFREPPGRRLWNCDAKGLVKGGFPGVFAKCRKLPKICEICGFAIFAGNAPKISKITGKLPETSDWGPQSDVSGKFPVIFGIFGAFPAKIKKS